MNCHSPSDQISTHDASIILVGNHNVGKSVIFGWLTGKYVTVANYPGTTVEITRGVALMDAHHQVIDTPGINSLQPLSEDERVTRDVVLGESAHAVVQVADAKNLRRALLITTQLAEMELPVVLALNMMDEAAARAIGIKVDTLAFKLGIPVMPTIATRREGLHALAQALEELHPMHPLVRYDDAIEAGIRAIATELVEVSASASPFGLAVMFLNGDAGIDEFIRARVEDAAYARLCCVRAELETSAGAALASVIQNTRARWIDATLREIYSNHATKHTESLSSALGRWSVHPVWGISILLLILLLMYEFVGRFGAGTLVNLIEGTIFGAWINPFVTHVVRAGIPFVIVQDFLVGPYGVLTVALTYGLAIILPIVFTFFIAFGVLEDSGYLPRLAVMADRVFKAMGLNGKAVLPMVLGLGCDTMATMTTRTLETTKDRILVTLLLALGVPCSAQLGVVLGMLGCLGIRATVIWTGVVVGVLLIVGWLAAKVIPGRTSDFILELPPLRMPQLAPLMVKTLARMEWYLREVLPLFLLGTVILFAMDEVGALAWIERAAQPLIVNWLGLPAAATEPFLVGFLRRDYGAAGFFLMAREGQLSANQILVALVTITLFVPCIANFFVMIKERGLRTALAITAFVFPFAFLVGGVLNTVLNWSK